MKKLTFIVCLVSLGLWGCNTSFESAEPVGNTVWDGDSLPPRETEKEAASAGNGACTRCGILEQQKQLDAITQQMLEKEGQIRVPEVPSVPTEPPQQ